MQAKKYLTKKISDRLICSMCGSNNFKSIIIHEDVFYEKVELISLSLLCVNNHLFHIKEFNKRKRKS